MPRGVYTERSECARLSAKTAKIRLAETAKYSQRTQKKDSLRLLRDFGGQRFSGFCDPPAKAKRRAGIFA